MPLRLTSPTNPRIKYLLDLRDKRHRQRSGEMLVEGRAELHLALASGARPSALYLCPELSAPDPELLAQVAGAEIVELTKPLFEKVAYREGPDGWLGVFPRPALRLADLTLGPAPLVLLAEAVEKPGNLGAMLRTADAAGVSAVIVCDPVTDVTNPNVVRASKGTLFTLPVVEATTPETLAWLKQHDFRLLAATPQATQRYTEVDWRGPCALAVGAEDTGLSPTFLAHAHTPIRIPMHGRVNSLNVSAATAIVLFEAVRQRGESR